MLRASKIPAKLNPLVTVEGSILSASDDMRWEWSDHLVRIKHQVIAHTLTFIELVLQDSFTGGHDHPLDVQVAGELTEQFCHSLALCRGSGVSGSFFI